MITTATMMTSYGLDAIAPLSTGFGGAYAEFLAMFSC